MNVRGGPFLGVLAGLLGCGGPAVEFYAPPSRARLSGARTPQAAAVAPASPSAAPPAPLFLPTSASDQPGPAQQELPAALTPEEVSRALQENERDLVACYSHWADRADRQRPVQFTIDLAVDRSGHVAIAKAIPRDPSALATCIETRVSAWQLPPASEASVFHFPLRFDPVMHARMSTPRFFAALATRFDNELCEHPRFRECASTGLTECQTLVQEALATCQEEESLELGHHVELNENGRVVRRFSQCVAKSYVMTLLVEGQWRLTSECSEAFGNLGGA